MDHSPAIQKHISSELGFELPDAEMRFSESELLEWLAQRVAYLLEERRDWMLSKLYRLDVREKDIKAVLDEDREDTALALAALILERQKQKAASRKAYGPQTFELNDEDDPSMEELRW